MTSHVEQQIAARIAAARRKDAEDKRRRQELAEARQHGLAARHAQKLRNQASRSTTPKENRMTSKLDQTRRAAMELTLYQLQTPNTTDVYDLLTRLCPRGIHDLLPLTLHLAESAGELLARECGSKVDAAASLAQQLAKASESDR
ncbi:hypothetical protein ACFZCP_35230 [Streptomyces sp. NPDC007971]|uniref:hypothetical protein n=1 Tax=Streptomyces sp. NPDC007971 TaxID=3364799 RepID=UPI0036E1DD0B